VADSAAGGGTDTVKNFNAGSDTFTFCGMTIAGGHIQYVDTAAFAGNVQASAHLQNIGPGNDLLQIDTNGDGIIASSDRLKREQRFEPSPHFVDYAHWSLAYEPRPSLLPRDATQLICLDDAAYQVALRYRYMKAPITIAPRYRAGNAMARQLIELVRRKHQRRAPSGLLVGDRLLEIEPNYFSGIGTIGGHLTMPHCQPGNPSRPPSERCPWSFRSAIHRACNGVSVAA
jgi:hypothetical protein